MIFTKFIFFIFIFLFSFMAQAEQFSLELKDSDLSSAEKTIVQSFLADVQALIPQKMQEGIARAIYVRFSDFGSKEPLHIPCEISEGMEDPHLVLGRLENPWYKTRKEYNTILLNWALLPEILRGPQNVRGYHCAHGNYYRLARAVLLHELAHVYDFSDLYTEAELQIMKDCYDYPSSNYEQNVPRECDSLRMLTGKVSDRISFFTRAGWTKEWADLQPKNRLRKRSPDIYEYKNIHEFFAINFEYYILDSEYSCRRPGLYQFYAEHFQQTPMLQANCTLNYKAYISTSGKAVQLEPHRIYQIHYLFAGKGNNIASNWGHGMFRFIVCAPSRKIVDAECLKDINYHVVAGYRANISDLMMNMWDGLFGGYPMQVFFYDLPHIVDQYTRSELREVSSLPLRLNPKEKKLLVEVVLEQYWQYTGKYYFLTNNCGHELEDALRAVLPADHRLQSYTPWSPEGLYDGFIYMGLSDSSVLNDGEKARQEGFYFPSFREGLEKSLKKISWREDLEKYFSTTAAQRKNHFLQRTKNANAKTKKELAANFVFLELHVKRVYAKAMDNRMAQMLVKLQESSDPVIKQLEKSKSLIAGLRPWTYVSDKQKGYGVPLATEVLSQEKITLRFTTYRESVIELTDLLKPSLTEELREQDNIESNLKFFVEQMSNI